MTVPISFEHTTNIQTGYDRLAELVRQAAGKNPVVLVGSIDQALRCKKELAKRGCAFGVGVEAFDLWLSDVWALHGDGRQMVDSPARSVLCARILRGTQGLKATSGMIRLMISLVKDYLPLLRSEAANQADLEQNERLLVDAAGAYAVELEKRGMIEPCQAVAELAPALADKAVFYVGADEDDLTYAQRLLFDVADACVLLNKRTEPVDAPRHAELDGLLRTLYTPIGERPALEPQGAVRFAFASGVLAEERLIMNQLKGLAQEFPGGRVVLAAADPERLFHAIAGELAEAGISSGLSVSKPVQDTDAVRAVMQVMQATSDGIDFDKHAATDFLMNPLSRVLYKQAFGADADYRGNRLLGGCDIAEKLAAYASADWAQVISLLGEGSLEEAMQKLSALVMTCSYLSEGYRSEQLSAMRVMQDFAFRAQREGMPLSAMMDALAGQCVRVEVDAPAFDEALRVEFMTMEEAALLPPSSANVLFACDMTAEARAVKEPRNAAHTLLDKLDSSTSVDVLEKRRHVYYDALTAARDAVLLERSLNTSAAEDAYAATILDETVDCYRAALDEDVIKAAKKLGVTNSLYSSFVCLCDETEYVRFLTGSPVQQTELEERRPCAGAISDEYKALVALPKSDAAAERDELCLTPSGIEAYLECPYRWFAERRLSLDVPDEGFGPAERGTFVHAVMERFYKSWKAAGHERVISENIAEARSVMSAVFDEVLKEQFIKEKPKHRYVSSNGWEELQVESLKGKLIKHLAYEAELLPGFVPKYFEQHFGYSDDNPVGYAGALLAGCIDRVDVDAQGRAVVIDYKSSVGAQHDFYEKNSKKDKGDLEEECEQGMELPRKIQTLLYAQVVRREFGLDIVGALYLNPLKDQVGGAYDATVLDENFIPNVKTKTAGVGTEEFETFHDMLDAVEAEIGARLLCLKEGDIAPRASSEDACRYCPVVLCERRE